MGFVGSINQDLRSILRDIVPAFAGRQVYVGCSGNFTCERILWSEGVREIHGNDVSLYSCAVGRYLTGQPTNVVIKPERDDLAWLNEYMSTDESTIATVLLATSAFTHLDRQELFHKRVWVAYREGWRVLHAKTIEKIKKGLGDLRLRSFFAGDVVDMVTRSSDDSAVVAFPPTYKGGYERLYKKLQEVFLWDEPSYVMFDEQRFLAFASALKSKSVWVTMRDNPEEALEGYQIAYVRTGLRSHPVYVYANRGDKRRTEVRQKIEQVPWQRMMTEHGEDLRIQRISLGQLNMLRSEYLSLKIVPSGAQFCFAVLSGGNLLGAFALSPPQFSSYWCDMYMMSDFSITPTIYRRLSKLVLVAVLSKETQCVLEQAYVKRIERIGTTAFSEKAVSMKYRGLFDLVKKDEKLNYVGMTGRWTLREGFEWWKRNHGQTVQ